MHYRNEINGRTAGKRGVLAALTLVALGMSTPLYAQYGTGAPVDDEVSEAPGGPPPKRDLTGVWMRRSEPGKFRSGAALAADPPEMTDWGKARFAEARSSNDGTYTLEETNDPVLRKCHPPGVPRVYFHPYPFEFVHTPKDLIMIFEYDHTIRRIYTDGRAHPEDPDPLWLGHSIGHWENDTTFVVDTVGFNDRTWLDRVGYPHSEQLHVVERFQRTANNRLQVDITMDDPIALAKPWQAATIYFALAPPTWELGEISCSGDYLDFAEFESFTEQ